MSDLVNTPREDLARKRAERIRERELSDIRFVLKSPEGRRLYWRMLEKGGIYRDPFNSDSVNLTNYNLGRQSISREWLCDLMESKPEAYAQMQQEREAQDKDIEREMKMEEGGVI